MLVAITGFGSVWRHRFGNDRDHAQRFARGVYYNTTGIEVAGSIRQRPRITGYARFHACGGFDPNHPARIIGQVFACADPCVWNGNNKLLFERMLPAPQTPDAFLVVVRAEATGVLPVGSIGWRSGDSWLISFSEDCREQEAMLLMSAHGWFESELGRFVLEPEVERPWLARLLLTSPGRE